MLIAFPSLIFAIIILIVHLSYKSKTENKLDSLKMELLGESDNKTSFEAKYNQAVSELKRHEELKKGKELDEIQLLFAKVNMLDDKVTFLNSSSKNKLDTIIAMIESLTSLNETNASMIKNIITDNGKDPKDITNINNNLDYTKSSISPSNSENIKKNITQVAQTNSYNESKPKLAPIFANNYMGIEANDKDEEINKIFGDNNKYEEDIFSNPSAYSESLSYVEEENEFDSQNNTTNNTSYNTFDQQTSSLNDNIETIGFNQNNNINDLKNEDEEEKEENNIVEPVVSVAEPVAPAMPTIKPTEPIAPVVEPINDNLDTTKNIEDNTEINNAEEIEEIDDEEDNKESNDNIEEIKIEDEINNKNENIEDLKEINDKENENNDEDEDEDNDIEDIDEVEENIKEDNIVKENIIDENTNNDINNNSSNEIYNSLNLYDNDKSAGITDPNIFLDHLNLTNNNEEKTNQEIQEKTISFDNFESQNNADTTHTENHNINSFISNNQYAENATFDNDRVDTDIENELYSATNKSYIDINKEWEENEAKNNVLKENNNLENLANNNINNNQTIPTNISDSNSTPSNITQNNMNNTNIGFDIKESIEKLKAQLNSNNDDDTSNS